MAKIHPFEDAIKSSLRDLIFLQGHQA